MACETLWLIQTFCQKLSRKLQNDEQPTLQYPWQHQ